MYAGEGELIDATWQPKGADGGIHRRPVSHMIPDAHVRVRRDSELTTLECDELVSYAENLRGHGYSLRRVADLLQQFIAGLAAPGGSRQTSIAAGLSTDRAKLGFVCSDVYLVAYETITEKAVETSASVPSPALLSASSLFQDIPVVWCDLPNTAL
jgi:hypothetical protein